MSKLLHVLLLALSLPAFAEYVGDFPAGATVPCGFLTYDSSGDLAAASALIAADVEIYKNGGTTQRASDVGVTVSANFDSVNGQQVVTIDTSDDTDSGFYTAAPTYYTVFIGPFTVGSETAVSAQCSFSLGVTAQALVSIGLDHLLAASVAGTDVTDDSIVAVLVGDDATADFDSYDNTTDSLEALRNRGDAAWTTGSGTGLTALASGTAQSGTASTIVLAAGETFANDELNYNVIKLTGGTGSGQTRLVTDYVGSSDTASVTPDWITNPSSDSTYEIVEGPVFVALMGTDVVTAAAIGTDAVDDDALAADAVAAINATVDTALSDIGLNHLLAATVAGSDVTDNSIIARLVSKSATADWDTYVNTTDSLQANVDNQVTLAQLNAEMDTALSDIGLDHLLGATVTGTDVTDNSIIAKLVGDDATADWDSFVNTTDSLEAIRNALLTAAAVNSEVDTALTDIKLDHLIAVADADDVADESIIAQLASTGSLGTADWSTFNHVTDSLQSLADTPTTWDSLLISSAVNDVSASTTAFDTDLATAYGDDEALIGRTLVMTSGATDGEQAVISAYDDTPSGTITLGKALSAAPANNDTFVIVPTMSLTLAELTAAIMDDTVDGNIDAREALAVLLSYAVGLVTGADTATLTYDLQDDSTVGIQMTVDADGNRSAVTVYGE